MRKQDNLPLNYKERKNSRTSFIISIAVLVLLCMVFNQMDYTMIRQPSAQAKKAAAAKKQKEEAAQAAAPEITTAEILAVGDNLVQPSLLSSGQSETGAWNYDHVFTDLKAQIQAADVAIVNQETPFTANHELTSGTAPYATPTEMGDALVNAGFDVVTSATSFMDDNGASMITETLNYWKTSHPEIAVVGIHEADETETFQVLEVNGIKLAFLNYTFPSYEAQTDTASMINTFKTSQVASDIKKAKEASDCIIFSANWGKTEEAMPTEYEKEWANFLMEQGVDVVLGTNPNVLQPYGYLTDDAGHNMLIYYSLGNFVSGQETLKQLLGGMATFTIQKTVTQGETSIQIKDASLTPLVMHYNYENKQYQPYELAAYTQELAASHSVYEIIGDELSLENLQTKCDEILSMNVKPSTKTTLMDVSFDSDGNLWDASGNYVEDTDSITASWYYQTLSSQEDSQDDTENDNE